MRSLFWVLASFLCLALPVRSLEEYSRCDFPPGFFFGSGVSAYQVEGAAEEDGRTPSIWDTSAHAGYMHGATGDVACDQYHKYKEDVQLMADTGLEGYRFSISWSRLIPYGRGPVNPKGLEYYNSLIDELISHGIQPHVTLHHYDLPQSLESEYGGWLSKRVVKDFTRYADVCFREFGNRVKHWTTLNEANIFAVGGYAQGFLPPNRCSPPFGFLNCTSGNSTTEPYIAAHNMLLVHASAARLYERKYKAKQHGFIGLSVYTMGFVPFTESNEDKIAAKRGHDFLNGWMVHPLVFGDYPDVMKEIVGSRLPSFTSHESQQVKGAFDFLGVIHYSTVYAKDNSAILENAERDFFSDMAVAQIPIGNSSIFENANLPQGMEQVLGYYRQSYGNPPIYILENGKSLRYNSSLQDTSRVEYLQLYIGAVLKAIRKGSDVRGYFQWSFMDLFELLSGYEFTYGLYFVDFADPDLRRYPKLSAHWYSLFLKGMSVSSDFAAGLERNTSSSAFST